MAIHFASPKALPPEPLTDPLHFPLGECPDNDVVIQTLLSFRTESVATFFNETPYPHNILRNLAGRAIRTNYMIMTDMELIPSDHIFTQLEQFLNQTKQKDCFNCAYIIPQFEKNATIEYLPRTKEDLIKMVDSETASLLYGNAYEPFQHCVQGSRWLKVPDSQTMEIAFPVNYTALCEPIVVVRSTAPGYINEMRGFGYNRLSQVK
ncbi:hypothetical protein TCAL_12728 [Tigriopus californicus]|uniref:Beta-1,4-glucuronyltransferase 1 n=1 Tax=Tigriopus californicus TaxID=6832 RepID=A0A553P1E4_TIGCA|nr:hypothetical protein TCAL_12728 [Tigriopus californicus]|eukprot:TCALIF_12728-PA protein Name:"Similar to B3GNT1 N-acetyllactosaminide beta-1,3-N-acetylglucosaminyltransferase (Bos taurus)" AED:0.18 eAED:0.18 QI:0/-1/0/1/-1/1/1/0/206